MKKTLFFMFIWLSFGKLYAQSITILPSGIIPVSSPFLIDANSTIYHSYGGIPQDGVVLMPVNGTSSKMMWIPKKAAFRVGHVSSDFWDGNNIGKYSVAMGSNTKASSSSSTALGASTTASGDFSTAMGLNTTASGYASTAMGGGTIASSLYSIAMGEGTTASGSRSTAIGYSTTASGLNSTAMGYRTTASGLNSTAMGSEVSTNGMAGTFMIGDSDPDDTGTTNAQLPDRMYARFKNGYRFLTSSNNNVTGIIAYGGANAWSTTSDSTKKEKFAPINGGNVLQKIAQFKLTTWNYKGQDSRIFRHYGPMAQDFYAAFGHDAYGSIGCDTLINQADFDGINFVAIQALEKRTNDLRSTNDELRETIGELRNTNEDLRSTNEDLRSTNKDLQAKNEQLEKRITELESLKSELASIRQVLKTDKKWVTQLEK